MINQLIACALLTLIPTVGVVHTYVTDMRSRGINPWGK